MNSIKKLFSDEEFERDCNINTTPKGLKNSQAKGSNLDEALENNGVPTKQLYEIKESFRLMDRDS